MLQSCRRLAGLRLSSRATSWHSSAPSCELKLVERQHGWTVRPSRELQYPVVEFVDDVEVVSIAHRHRSGLTELRGQHVVLDTWRVLPDLTVVKVGGVRAATPVNGDTAEVFDRFTEREFQLSRVRHRV